MWVVLVFAPYTDRDGREQELWREHDAFDSKQAAEQCRADELEHVSEDNVRIEFQHRWHK